MARAPCSPEDQAEAARLCRVRARLKRATEKLQDFLHRLQTLHADRSGSFRLMYPGVPLLSDEWYALGRSLCRSESDARQGCPLASAWLHETSALREQIDNLRSTPLPHMDPTYDGPAVLPHFALRAGKRPRNRLANDPARRAQVVADHLARLEERKARSRALLNDYLSEVS